MHSDHVCARPRKCINVFERRIDHQMHVEKQLRLFADGADEIRAEGDVGRKVAVHVVQMQPPDTQPLCLFNLFSDAHEIRAQYRGRQRNHR